MKDGDCLEARDLDGKLLSWMFKKQNVTAVIGFICLRLQANNEKL
jgi:hypothetical protein